MTLADCNQCDTCIFRELNVSLLLLSHKHIESGDRTILICSLSTDRHQSCWSESLLNLYNLFTGRCQCLTTEQLRFQILWICHLKLAEYKKIVDSHNFSSMYKKNIDSPN